MSHEDITPVNTVGMKYFEVENIGVFEWHSLPDGQGKPEQVHLQFKVAGIPYPFVMRFKSRKPVDELIMALITHANGVWPNVPRSKPITTTPPPLRNQP
jgi:hypothetical protein